jgi:hypothetical protein
LGFIASVLSFLNSSVNGAKVSDVKLDPGGRANVTAQHFSSAGDDSYPLATDYACAVEVKRSGGAVVVGYLDPINSPKSQEGDKRIYARESSGGVKVELWLKNSGEAVLSNSNGSVTLSAAGDITTVTPLCTFNVKSDGSIKGSNGSGSFELQTGGNFVVNGVTIDISGNINNATSINSASGTSVNSSGTMTIVSGQKLVSDSVEVNGVEVDGHTHVETGGTTGEMQ